MRLLLISNSTNAGEEYLKYPIADIGKFLSCANEVVFIPYAAVTFSYDDYEAKVQARFNEIDIAVRSIHKFSDPVQAIKNAEAIVVGGGNTFALTKKMQEQGLMGAIWERIREGVPYVGWSAGSNVCCPTICTTNDMPIVEPESFRAVAAIKFQINPHYLDANPEGHAGETREQRLEEYIAANPDMYVVGLREGCYLKVEGEHLSYKTFKDKTLRIFKYGQKPYELKEGDDLSFLM